MFNEAAWNIQQKKEYEDANHKRQRTLLMGKNLSKFELKPMNIHNIPATGLLTAKAAKGLYTEFEDDCQRDGFL